MTTPIFYHPDQDVIFDFVSTKKVPEFVRQTRREYHIPTIADAARVPHDIGMAHDWDYTIGVLEGRIDNGFGNRNRDLTRAIVASNYNFVAAARHIVTSRGVTCSATQGFHHAHYDHNYGYCTFNGLMVAALDLVHNRTVEKVLIIDGDAHHGDGTADIIEVHGLEDSVVQVTSDTMRGVVDEFDSGRWATFVNALIEEHEPGIIMYQAGADAWDKDPYGSGYLGMTGLMARDRGVFTAAKRNGVPIVWNLAGGYSDPMQKVIDIHLNTLRMCDEVYYGTTTP